MPGSCANTGRAERPAGFEKTTHMLYRLLFMSLLSALFGCGKKSEPPLPHFPQTDNTACRVTPFQPDTGFFAQTFILSPDRQNVFLLAYGMAGTPEQMPYAILRLDTAGRVQAKTILPDCVWTDVPNFWWDDDGALGLMLSAEFRNFDPVSLATVKTWRQVDFTNFLSQKKLDQLTYDEQDDAYREALQKAVAQSSVRYVRKVLNLDFLMLDFARKPAEVWHLRDPEEVDDFIARYGERKAPMNPPPADTSALGTDGNVCLTLLAHRVLDYKFAYPDLKYIEERVLELSAGRQKARFRLSNKEKHSLELQYADNQYLTAADGAIWLLYERQLYRVQF